MLAESPFAYAEHQKLVLEFTVSGETLRLVVDGREIVTATDGAFSSGGAGMVIDHGTIPVRGFDVRAADKP